MNKMKMLRKLSDSETLLFFVLGGFFLQIPAITILGLSDYPSFGWVVGYIGLSIFIFGVVVSIVASFLLDYKKQKNKN